MGEIMNRTRLILFGALCAGAAFAVLIAPARESKISASTEQAIGVPSRAADLDVLPGFVRPWPFFGGSVIH
jgi:hypothetical protein